MKRIGSLAFLLCLICLCAAGCAKTGIDMEELAAKAGEELAAFEPGAADVRYIGLCGADDTALAWFMAGEAEGKRCYLPIEVELIGRTRYCIIRIYEVCAGKGHDVVMFRWKQGTAFVIGDPACTAVRIKDGDGVHEKIEKETVPYLFYYPAVSEDYAFIDAAGKELDISPIIK